MDNVMEARTYYVDREGNELTENEFRKRSRKKKKEVTDDDSGQNTTCGKE